MMKRSNALRQAMIGMALQQPGIIPLNVRCSSNCAFCYEKNLSRIVPHIRIHYIPRYTRSSFNAWRKDCLAILNKGQKIAYSSPFAAVGNVLYNFPSSDFFCLGLRTKEIESVIEIARYLRRPLYVSATGLNIDLKQIKYLSLKYKDQFKVHLSVITFDKTIRQRTMNAKVEIRHLKEICKILIDPDYYLIHFNQKQLFFDLRYLNDIDPNSKGSILLGYLYADKFSSLSLKKLAQASQEDFKATILHLGKNKRHLMNIWGRISLGGSIYAAAWSNELKKLLSVCSGGPEEAVFCSLGAYETIRSIVDSSSHVIPVESCLGEHTSFSTGMTIKDITSKLKELLAQGFQITRIFMPSSMFVVEGRYDLNCDTVSIIRREFPGVETFVLNVPDKILQSTMTLDEAVAYCAS